MSQRVRPSRFKLFDFGRDYLRLALALAAIGAIGAQSSQAPPGKKLIRIASFPGSTQSSEHLDVWKRIRERAAAERPDIEIEFVSQPVDIYETIGLPALLASDTPPDIMFEWAGHRVAVLHRYGFLADLSEPLRQGDWARRVLPLAWTGTVIDDRNYMVPWAVEVTNLLWYNKSIFAAHRVSEPKTWDEFLSICEKLHREGVTPVCVGNKEQWPAGNWMGHLISRIVGEAAYTAALRGERPFDSDEFRRAFKVIEQLRDRGYLNADLNDVTTEEAFRRWSRGEAAMHPNGSWAASMIRTLPIGPDADCFNLPPTPGGAGDQSSLTGHINGFVVNKRTRYFPEVLYFLRLLSSPPIVRMFAEEGRNTAIPVLLRQSHPVSRKIRDMVSTASTLLPPPDLGFELERADAFNMAVAQVLGGFLSGDEALRTLDKRLARQRRSNGPPATSD